MSAVSGTLYRIYLDIFGHRVVERCRKTASIFMVHFIFQPEDYETDAESEATVSGSASVTTTSAGNEVSFDYDSSIDS